MQAGMRVTTVRGGRRPAAQQHDTEEELMPTPDTVEAARKEVREDTSGDERPTIMGVVAKVSVTRAVPMMMMMMMMMMIMMMMMPRG
jgi:hypothetical protein